jgi:hypothetical protein
VDHLLDAVIWPRVPRARRLLDAITPSGLPSLLDLGFYWVTEQLRPRYLEIPTVKHTYKTCPHLKYDERQPGSHLVWMMSEKEAARLLRESKCSDSKNTASASAYREVSPPRSRDSQFSAAEKELRAGSRSVSVSVPASS